MEIFVPFLCEIAGVISWWLLPTTRIIFLAIQLKLLGISNDTKSLSKAHTSHPSQRAERNLDKPHSMKIIDKRAPVVGLCAQLNMEICRAFDFRVLVESLKAFVCL